MPLNGNSVGTDFRLSLVVNGQPFRIPSTFITSYTPSPVTTQEQRHGIDGERRTAVFPMGWNIQLAIDRGSPDLENMWAAIEAAYYNGQNTFPGYCSETTQEPSGAVSQWKYTNVTYELTALGERTPGSIVKQAMMCYASRRVKVV